MHHRRKAYRVVYEGLIGTAPPGQEPHHLCHDKRCVNPWHLEWLTHDEHARLHGQEKWDANTECPAGHDFTEDNTYVYVRKDGRREKHCRQCHRDRMYARNTTRTRTNKRKNAPPSPRGL